MYGITEAQLQILPKKQKMSTPDMVGPGKSSDVEKAEKKLVNGKFFEFGNKMMRVAEINTWLKTKYKVELDLVKKQKLALLTIEKLILIQLYGEHDTKLNKSKYNLFV